MKYTAAKELNEKYNYSINNLCKKLDISHSGYYKWLKRKPSKRQLVNEDLAEKIRKIHKDNNGIFGSRRAV